MLPFGFVCLPLLFSSQWRTWFNRYLEYSSRLQRHAARALASSRQDQSSFRFPAYTFSNLTELRSEISAHGRSKPSDVGISTNAFYVFAGRVRVSYNHISIFSSCSFGAHWSLLCSSDTRTNEGDSKWVSALTERFKVSVRYAYQWHCRSSGNSFDSLMHVSSHQIRYELVEFANLWLRVNLTQAPTYRSTIEKTFSTSRVTYRNLSKQFLSFKV